MAAQLGLVVGGTRMLLGCELLANMNASMDGRTDGRMDGSIDAGGLVAGGRLAL